MNRSEKTLYKRCTFKGMSMTIVWRISGADIASCAFSMSFHTVSTLLGKYAPRPVAVCYA